MAWPGSVRAGEGSMGGFTAKILAFFLYKNNFQFTPHPCWKQHIPSAQPRLGYMSSKRSSGSQEFSRVSRSQSGQRCPCEPRPALETKKKRQITQVWKQISVIPAYFVVFLIFFQITSKRNVVSVRPNRSPAWQNQQRKFSL